MLASRAQEVPSLNADVLAGYRSGPELSIKNGRVLTDNDDAFETKLDLISRADSSIDLAYYIFSDDYSSSLMARELLAATQRGVRVRLLLDYHSHYQALDYFRMLEHFGKQGSGSLSVRFYNRPTRNIIKDAVFMTLGCGQEKTESRAGCSEDKFQEIDQLFADEKSAGISTEGRNISNINTGNSGLFLSGLYAKNPELMAMAVSNGQGIDVAKLQSDSGDTNPEDVEKLKELAKLYWLANYGSGLDRVIKRVKLSAAFLFYGEQVNPVYDAFTAFLPVERASSDAADEESVKRARQDWQYLTDFLHHKILLVDERDLVIGGRNVQDSYHMNPNPLSAKYTFMDTDVHLQLDAAQAELTATYETLWQFDTMVATLQEVALHAPNDFLIHSALAKQACESLADADEITHQSCLDTALLEQQNIPVADRYRELFEKMDQNANRYLAEYTATADNMRSPEFALDITAQADYVENLPYNKSLSAEQLVRFYGARNDSEKESGKNIHALWLSALKSSCEAATVDSPVAVYLHNAYFFLPSNLLSALAQMIDGRQPCANVDIVVLSNSIETTDLNVVNLLSRHSVKALFEHYASHHDPESGATLNYFEYVQQDDTDNRSLHSKVMVFANDIYIGSANADLRSYMMDTNNGLYIRQAPKLHGDYTAWLRSILEDQSRTAHLNDYYLRTERSQLLDEGDKLIDSELAKYRAERFIQDPAQVLELKAKLREISNEVHRLSRDIIADHAGSSSAQSLFNDLFKAI
jgi:phosphatidylserine/phosphatidylglycerophosphate/cardiolipin synthase-like enzyme